MLSLISLHGTALGHSSAIAVSHAHRQLSEVLALKQIFAHSGHQILQQGQEQCPSHVCAFTEHLTPLNKQCTATLCRARDGGHKPGPASERGEQGIWHAGDGSGS